MEKAIEYLSDNKYSINEIALKCGYNNTHYFIKVFKRHFGKTPGIYRIEKGLG